MNSPRVAVLLSLALSVGVIAYGLYVNPATRSGSTVTNPDLLVRAKAVLQLLAVCTIAAWPWFVHARRASDPKKHRSVLAFSALTAAACLVLLVPPPTSPTEAYVLHLGIYWLVSWLAFPLSLFFRAEEP